MHRFDVARLYRLALENGEAGAVYHAAAENLKMKSILKVLSNNMNLPVKSMPFDEASQKIGFMAGASSMDKPSSAVKTEKALGWRPKEIGLLEDLEANYF